MSIDIVDIRGKKIVFIDELAGKRRLDIRATIMVNGVSIEVPDTERIIKLMKTDLEYNDTDGLFHIPCDCDY